jgi:rRNA processing protein Gar1
MIICACSMQNEPHEYAVDHTSFYVISKLFTRAFLIGRGDVTFLHVAHVKSTKNVGKLTCVFGRFKNPFFSVANTDFEGGDGDDGHGDCFFFGHLCATQPYPFLTNLSRYPMDLSLPVVKPKWVLILRGQGPFG